MTFKLPFEKATTGYLSLLYNVPVLTQIRIFCYDDIEDTDDAFSEHFFFFKYKKLFIFSILNNKRIKVARYVLLKPDV